MANTLLQDFDLTYLRNEVKTILPDLVNIQRRSAVADGQGGFTESWGMVYSNVQAKVAFSSSAGRASQGQESPSTQLTVSLLYDQSVDLADRILFAGETLEVVSVNTPKSWQVLKLCQVRQI